MRAAAFLTVFSFLVSSIQSEEAISVGFTPTVSQDLVPNTSAVVSMTVALTNSVETVPDAASIEITTIPLAAQVSSTTNGVLEPVTNVSESKTASATSKIMDDPGGAFRILDYQIRDYKEKSLFLVANGDFFSGNSERWDPTSSSYSESAPSLFLSDRVNGGNLNLNFVFSKYSKESDLVSQLPLSYYISYFEDFFEDEHASGAVQARTTSRQHERSSLTFFDPSISSTYYTKEGIRFGGTFLLSMRSSWSSLDNESTKKVTCYDSSPCTPFFSDNRNWDSNTNEEKIHLKGSAGVGRAVEGRWAWNALQLIDDLNRKGLLLRPLDFEDGRELAGRMALIGQAMPWDFREKKLRDTVELSRYLAQKGYIKEGDIEAVVTVSDVYLYGGPSRQIGGYLLAFAKLDGGISQVSSIHTERINNIVTSNSRPRSYQNFSDNLAPGTGLELAYYQPLSREWQFDSFFRLDYVPYHRYEYLATRISYDDLKNIFLVSISFVPNSRASISLSNWASLGKRHDDFEDTDGVKWNALWRYDVLEFRDELLLKLSCQLANSLTAELTGGLNYWHVMEDNLWHRVPISGNLPGPAVDANDAKYGSDKYSIESWSNSVKLRFTYRLM